MKSPIPSPAVLPACPSTAATMAYMDGVQFTNSAWLEAVEPLVNEVLVFLHAHARGKVKPHNVSALNAKVAPFTEEG